MLQNVFALTPKANNENISDFQYSKWLSFDFLVFNLIFFFYVTEIWPLNVLNE